MEVFYLFGLETAKSLKYKFFYLQTSHIHGATIILIKTVHCYIKVTGISPTSCPLEVIYTWCKFLLQVITAPILNDTVDQLNCRWPRDLPPALVPPGVFAFRSEPNRRGQFNHVSLWRQSEVFHVEPCCMCYTEDFHSLSVANRSTSKQTVMLHFHPLVQFSSAQQQGTF